MWKNSSDLNEHLLIFAVGLLCDVFGFFELQFLDLHLLLVFHGSVLNHLHASKDEKMQSVNRETDLSKAMLLN